jgi:hypothetical protein
MGLNVTVYICVFYLVRLPLHRTKSVELHSDKLTGRDMVEHDRAQLQVLS